MDPLLNNYASSRALSLVRIILWLKRTDLGLSFLLALASFVLFVAVAANSPDGLMGRTLTGPIYSAGHALGTLIFPSYGTRGTNGFYLVAFVWSCCGLPGSNGSLVCGYTPFSITK
jgi:hypothetical protein